MGDALKIGFYILLFLPGFVFVQTRDYHILRESKGQLEKTLEIILWSAAIWCAACASPHFWPCAAARTQTIVFVSAALKSGAESSQQLWVNALNGSGTKFLLCVCLWAFAVANIWGIVRKSRGVEVIVKLVTGRDWYPSVAFRFFHENIDRLVSVQTEEGQYFGMLHGAPDTKEDGYIILRQVAVVAKGTTKIEELPLVDSILIKFADLKDVQAFKPSVLKRAPSLLSRFRRFVAQAGIRLLRVIRSSLKKVIIFGQDALRKAGS